MGNPIIKFNHFSFQYNAQQNPTLKDINLEISKGEKILIVGPSGSGKSTLGHCLNGLIPFSYPGEVSGSLKINGISTSESSIFDLSKIVGTVLQDSDGQFVGLTVAEDIAFALENDCVPVHDLHTKVKSVSRKVDIQDFLHHAPTELSGGQKQRVSLAGIMVDDVDVFLFDEPLANLDPATGKYAVELIDSISKDTDAAIIIIEHRLEDVLWRSVDRIVLMHDGRIISDTTPDELLSSSLLKEYGVREPLFLTALKYAGVQITPEIHPWSVNSVELSDMDIEKVHAWYKQYNFENNCPPCVPLLQVRNLDFRYSNGCHALRNITTSINKGEMVAIVGTNGAGKSTFSKVICGFEEPQSGSVFFDGKDLSAFSIKERADHIGYVMQNPNQMISKVMIRDEVSLGLKTRGVDEAIITDRVDEVLKICGLWPFRNWPISALSYGQKKRVTIASILALNPEILILDEPTAGQDYKHYTEIMDFLVELNKKGITVILITHDMHLMLEYADRVIVFHGGEIIAETSGADVLTSPDIVSKASLKETSLYNLALKCGFKDTLSFVQHFIAFEQEAKKHD